MNIKCTNCIAQDQECNLDAVMFFEYIGNDKQHYYRIIASCKFICDYDRKNWKAISKKEYVIFEVLES
jgi:hypothetical protein